MTRKCYHEDYCFCVSLCYNTEILVEGGVVQGQGEGQHFVGMTYYTSIRGELLMRVNWVDNIKI